MTNRDDRRAAKFPGATIRDGEYEYGDDEFTVAEMDLRHVKKEGGSVTMLGTAFYWESGLGYYELPEPLPYVIEGPHDYCSLERATQLLATFQAYNRDGIPSEEEEEGVLERLEDRREAQEEEAREEERQTWVW